MPSGLLLTVLLLPAAGAGPRVEAEAFLVPAGPAPVTVVFEGGDGQSFHPSWIQPSAWALRDAAGRIHPFPGLDEGAFPDGGDPWPLPEGAQVRRRFDLGPVLPECAAGAAELLFREAAEAPWKTVGNLRIARLLKKGEVAFEDAQAVSDAALASYLVEMDLSVGGEPVGAVLLEFWPEKAPKTVRNFLRYCAEGFYDGLGFHRVIAGFMIQGGDPQGTGRGEGPYGRIPGEFSREPKYAHRRGVISMARSQHPDSASCQFFICHADAPHLDGKYASFGRVLRGMEAVDAVAAVPVGGPQRSTPEKPCRIEAVRVYRVD